MPRRERGGRRRKRSPAREAAEPRAAGATGRGVWSGSLSFGLVSVPVDLYSAQRPAEVALRMLTPDGTPVARRYVCPKEGKTLADDEIVRGYPVAGGEYVVVSEDELEALAPRRSRDIELLRFVERDSIDPSYFVRGYFLVPGGGQTKAYRLLAEVMEKSGRAAVGSFVMRDKAHAVAIFADAGILRAQTLRFGDELRSAEQLGLPEPSAQPATRVRKMQKAIGALARPEIDARELRDEESARLLALAREKRERGKDVVELPSAEAAQEEREGAEVVDLMALLKERLRAPRKRGRSSRAR